jgi:hypothetical protein
MAKKKERAFFVCPRWNEVANAPGITGEIRVHAKILTAIKAGQPVPRSTLRKALLAVSHASGSAFDVDAYIVDQRAGRSG